MKLGIKQKTAFILVLMYIFAIRPAMQFFNSLAWWQQFLLFWIPIGAYGGWLIGIHRNEGVKKIIGTVCIIMATALMIPAYTVGVNGNFANVDIPGAEPDIFWGHVLMMFGFQGDLLNLAVYGLMPIILIFTGLKLRGRGE